LTRADTLRVSAEYSKIKKICNIQETALRAVSNVVERAALVGVWGGSPKVLNPKPRKTFLKKSFPNLSKNFNKNPRLRGFLMMKSFFAFGEKNGNALSRSPSGNAVGEYLRGGGRAALVGNARKKSAVR
jgi:hypothetical protein